jgi:ketosteroid isomerase-like protein
MLDRQAILQRIDDAYATRTRGDKAALKEFWAPEATFRLAGEPAMLKPLHGGPDAAVSVDRLIDLVTFHEFTRLDAVVDGYKAAVLWRVQLSVGQGKRVTTELYDLWEFNDEGKAVSVLQFCDTALLASLLAG